MLRRIRGLASGAIALLALAGCSDLGQPVRLTAQSELSASAIEFGTVAVNHPATRTLTIRNTGSADLTGDASTSCPDVALTAGGPFSVPPGGSRDLVLTFTPTHAETLACVLDLGPDCPRVGVTGIGALQNPGAQSLVAPDTIAFGTLSAGQSVSADFQVFSVGTAPLIVNPVSGCGDFHILSGGGPAEISPGASITVTVAFSPVEGGPAACAIAVGPECPDVIVTGFATTVSFAADVRPILNTRCASCHVWADPFVGYQSMVNAPSSYPAAVIVKPFDLAGSVLYGKITNSGRFGQLMPQGGPLIPLPERTTIRDWILEGALDN